MIRTISLTIGLLILALPLSAFEAYNHPVTRKISLKEYTPPADSRLNPVTIIACRNSTYAGQVVLVDGKPIKGLKVSPGSLKGPQTIPAEAIEVRYAVYDGRRYGRTGIYYFDSLDDDPPEEITSKNAGGKVIQPLWFRVRISKDVKPGDYSGIIKVTATGNRKIEVPLKVKVFDYALPDPVKFYGHMDVVQSPESVALAYGVEPWSAEHFKLLDRTFKILGELGQKTLYITAIRRTHFGNEHALVRWTRDAKGNLSPDFSIAEKYLDLALRHLGKIPGVIFCCWEPTESQGHAGSTGKAENVHDKPILYTLWDQAKKRTKNRKGPDWGTPESRTFWKKFTAGAQAMLKERGLEASLLFGLIGDHRPTQIAMDDISSGIGKSARWAVHSHYDCKEWKGYKMGMSIGMWGLGSAVCNPDKGRSFSWKASRWLAYYPRDGFSLRSPLLEYRCKLETWMGAVSLYEIRLKKPIHHHVCGLGRIGGDFWLVLKNRRGQLVGNLAGRYPESAWGQLNINNSIPYLVGQGKKGPVPTVRSESMREGSQDAEVRVFVEKAIEIRKYRSKVGEEFAKKARKMLDERIRMINCFGAVSKKRKFGTFAGKAIPWRKDEALYRLAAEAAQKLGTCFIEGKGAMPEPAKK